MSLRFNTLLMEAAIDPADVRLLRHQTNKVRGRTPFSLWRDNRDAFEKYQSIQKASSRSRFQARYWASFVAPSDGGTLFVGLYEVKLVGSASGVVDPLTQILVQPDHDLYETRAVPLTPDYSGRLFIRWGDSSSANRAWVQLAENHNKPIVELRQKFQEEPFPGFTKVIRPLSEIEAMPKTWHEVLRASRGVYLLACPRNGQYYVGSAYGADGFLGRWRDYVSDGHGGNVGLKVRDPSDYVVSVLEVAGSSASVDDILDLEKTWKMKLQSKSIGLNLN